MESLTSEEIRQAVQQALAEDVGTGDVTTLATVPEFAAEELDFEPHDTIPAPPWLEDEIAPPQKTL